MLPPALVSSMNSHAYLSHETPALRSNNHAQIRRSLQTNMKIAATIRPPPGALDPTVHPHPPDILWVAPPASLSEELASESRASGNKARISALSASVSPPCPASGLSTSPTPSFIQVASHPSPQMRSEEHTSNSSHVRIS